MQREGFNANGIALTTNRQALLVVQSATGILFRVDPETGVATAVDLGGYSLVNGDGLLVVNRTLYVVQQGRTSARCHWICRVRDPLAWGLSPLVTRRRLRIVPSDVSIPDGTGRRAGGCQARRYRRAMGHPPAKTIASTLRSIQKCEHVFAAVGRADAWEPVQVIA